MVSELAEQGRIKLDSKTTRAVKDMEGEVTQIVYWSLPETERRKKRILAKI